MSERNDGGPAFPGYKHYTNGEQVITGEPHGGMTLRDYFAAKAMQMIYKQCLEISSTNNGPTPPRDKEIASWAYMLADAMLKAREE